MKTLVRFWLPIGIAVGFALFISAFLVMIVGTIAQASGFDKMETIHFLNYLSGLSEGVVVILVLWAFQDEFKSIDAANARVTETGKPSGLKS